ncbi:MAG: hypothetical protein U0V72_07305 [Cytophagales bacterium]
MTNEYKIVLNETIDIDNNDNQTPFGTRYGGDVFTLTQEDIENLKNGKLIALDVMNEYITYLKFEQK